MKLDGYDLSDEYIIIMKYVSIPHSLNLSLSLAVWGICAFQSVLSLSVAEAHELWLEAAEPMVSDDNQIGVDIRLGDMFAGSRQFFIPERSVMLKRITKDDEISLSPRPGNRPAISFPIPDQPSHTIIAYETIGFYLTYKEWEKFIRFTEDKGAADILDQHDIRNLPKVDFTERYKRYAKTSLFLSKAVEQNNDAATGLEIEFVITNVTSAAPASQQITAVLRYQDMPLADALVTLFTRTPTGQVTTTTLKTDPKGLIRVETQKGAYYMLDHVLFRPIAPDTDPNGAVWETLWASHSFSGPE